MNEKAFRENLVELLRGASAHITPEDALKGVNLKMCTVRPDGMPHSMWDLFEHMRITQHDILHYMLDPAWKSPAWPEGYWPGRKEHLTQKEWSGSITAFTSDL